MLPPGACRRCVYWFRVAIGSASSLWHQDYATCPRCGIPVWELLDKLTAAEARPKAPAEEQTSTTETR